MVEEEVKEDVVASHIQLPAIARGLRFAPTMSMDVTRPSNSQQGKWLSTVAGGAANQK